MIIIIYQFKHNVTWHCRINQFFSFPEQLQIWIYVFLVGDHRYIYIFLIFNPDGPLFEIKMIIIIITKINIQNFDCTVKYVITYIYNKTHYIKTSLHKETLI